MKGYYKNESATKETIDREGWIHTGDIGYYDDDGDFFLVDRIKDLIKYNANQVCVHMHRYHFFVPDDDLHECAAPSVGVASRTGRTTDDPSGGSGRGCNRNTG